MRCLELGPPIRRHPICADQIGPSPVSPPYDDQVLTCSRRYRRPRSPPRPLCRPSARACGICAPAASRSCAPGGGAVAPRPTALATGWAPSTVRGSCPFPPAKRAEAAPHIEGLRVAVILDDFSMLAWSYEFETVAVTPSAWREQLAEKPVDLLLVESAGTATPTPGSTS